MSEEALYGIGVAVVILGFLAVASVRIVPEYERGVIFRLGRVIGARGPGLFFIIPVVDRTKRVNLQTVTADIPPQDVITKDNVTLRVNAVTYCNVVDPAEPSWRCRTTCRPPRRSPRRRCGASSGRWSSTTCW